MMFLKVFSGRKTLQLFHLTILGCLFMFVLYIQTSKRQQHLSHPKPRQASSGDKRDIIMISEKYDDRNFLYEYHLSQDFVPYEFRGENTTVRPRACYEQYPNCHVTQGRNFTNATVFIFNLNDFDFTKLPIERGPKQLWILYDMSLREVNPIYPTCDTDFHLVAGYSRRYDIQIPFGRLLPADGAAKPVQFAPNSAGSVLWIVSECSEEQLDYVQRLQTVIRVDIIGSPCEKAQLLRCPNTQFKECLQNIKKSYRFLLSFDDHTCPDYVPYQVYNAFKSSLIPVVFLQKQILQSFPEHSYVNALDFDSPEELGKHLNTLRKNEDELLKYFTWKNYYYADQNYNANDRLFCEACRIAQQIKEDPDFKMPELKLLSNIYQQRVSSKCTSIN